MPDDVLRRGRGGRTTVRTVYLDGLDDGVAVRGWIAPDRQPTSASNTFVLIHGLALSHRSYGRLAEQLSAHGTVIAVDLPGFGGLDRPSEPLSVAEHAQAVAQLLDEMQIDSYIAVGHSMGAQVAVELGVMQPLRVSAVVLIGPVVNPDRQTLVHQAVDLARDLGREPVDTNLMVLRDYLLCGTRWFSAASMKMFDYPTDKRITSLRAPLLVIRGERDPVATEEWCRWLSRQSRGGVLETVPRHRHVVVHTAAAHVSELITTFARNRSLSRR